MFVYIYIDIQIYIHMHSYIHNTYIYITHKILLMWKKLIQFANEDYTNWGKIQ